MRKTIKFTKNVYVYQPHLTSAYNSAYNSAYTSALTSRLKSDSAKSSDKIKKETASKPNKDAAPSKGNKDAVESKTTKEAVPDKPKEDAVPAKDETVITGGSKCNPIPPSIPPGSAKNALKATCDTLIYKQEKTSNACKQKVPLTKIQGGAIDCPDKFKISPPTVHLAQRYQKYSLFVALPLIAILTLLVFGSRHEEDRLEFKKYEHMYKRSKRFSFGDGNRSAFHNSQFNALPPDGYEDEIDEDGIGKEPESEKDKKSRLKEFQKVFKNWKKHADKRDARIKKEMAN